MLSADAAIALFDCQNLFALPRNKILYSCVCLCLSVRVCELVFVLSVLKPFACTLHSEEVLHNLFTKACNITHTPIGTFPI